jgi:CheY-like chemotaxis protein
MTHILLVDDDDHFRTMLRITLQRLGYTVSEADNGSKAINMYRQEPYDAVFMDLIMPEKEGIETIAEIRRERPDAKIIAMSGGGRMNANDILSVAKAMGANQALAKPFSNESMMRALKALEAA